jgi:hypothetical protein
MLPATIVGETTRPTRIKNVKNLDEDEPAESVSALVGILEPGEYSTDASGSKEDEAFHIGPIGFGGAIAIVVGAGILLLVVLVRCMCCRDKERERTNPKEMYSACSFFGVAAVCARVCASRLLR